MLSMKSYSVVGDITSIPSFLVVVRPSLQDLIPIPLTRKQYWELGVQLKLPVSYKYRLTWIDVILRPV